MQEYLAAWSLFSLIVFLARSPEINPQLKAATTDCATDAFREARNKRWEIKPLTAH